MTITVREILQRRTQKFSMEQRVNPLLYVFGIFLIAVTILIEILW